jgi:hypothetical protein
METVHNFASSVFNDFQQRKNNSREKVQSGNVKPSSPPAKAYHLALAPFGKRKSHTLATKAF